MNYSTQLFIYDNLKKVWLELYLYDMGTSNHEEFLQNVLSNYNDCPEILIRNGNIHKLSPYKVSVLSWNPFDLKDNIGSFYYKNRCDSPCIQEAWRPNVSYNAPPILFEKAFVYYLNFPQKEKRQWQIINETESHQFLLGQEEYFFTYPSVINDFRGIFRFLSNFAEVKITIEGMTFNSTEAAYQALKTEDLSIRSKFVSLSANEAKKFGQTIPLRKDWDQIKNIIMFKVNFQKFSQEPYKTLLKRTNDSHLVEGNTWEDTYWGVCNGVGENNLGKTLMSIRNRLCESTC